MRLLKEFKVEGDLRREVMMNVKRLREIELTEVLDTLSFTGTRSAHQNCITHRAWQCRRTMGSGQTNRTKDLVD